MEGVHGLHYSTFLYSFPSLFTLGTDRVLLNPITFLTVQPTSNPEDNLKYLFAVALTTVALLRLRPNLSFSFLSVSEGVEL